MLKSKVLFFSLFLCLYWSSCHSLLQRPVPVKKYPKVIQGDWATDVLAQRYGSEAKYVFSVDDSLCFANVYPVPFGRQYEISKDTLFVQNRLQDLRKVPLREHHKTHVFQILEMHQNEMVLWPLNIRTKEFIELDDFYGVYINTLRYKRLQAVSDVTFKRIGFYCTVSYSGSGGMYMEVDASGEVLYFNHYHNAWHTKFRISQKQLNDLQRMVRQVEWTTLEPEYSVSVTDSKTCGLQLHTTDGQVFESKAYHYGKEPAAFRLLLHRLQDLRGHDYQDTDSTLLEELKLKDYLSNISWRNPY